MVFGLPFLAVGACTPLLSNVFFPEQQFSSEQWLNGNLRTRGRMASDLVASGMLRKKSRQQVLDLLGPADQTQGGTLLYCVDRGWRGIVEPKYDEVEISFEKDDGYNTVYDAFLRPDSGVHARSGRLAAKR
jgi:hypothetical protein